MTVAGSSEVREVYLSAHRAVEAEARARGRPPTDWKPCFLYWLETLRATAARRESMAEATYRKAIRGLEECGIPLPSARAALKVKVSASATGRVAWEERLTRVCSRLALSSTEPESQEKDKFGTARISRGKGGMARRYNL